MRLVLAALALVASATIAMAHQLTVFAFVEDGQVVVESRFSSGNRPQVGEVLWDRRGSRRWALEGFTLVGSFSVEF